MRILQIVHGFPPESIAGTESYCEALSRCLLKRGQDCLVLTGSGRDAPDPTLGIADQDGLLVARYTSGASRSDRWTDEYDADTDELARHLLALVKPDLVHLHHWMHLTNNFVAICADSGIPVVVTLHDVWTTCPRVHRVRWDGVFCSEPPTVAPCVTCVDRSPWQGDEEVARALALRQEMMEAELALAEVVIVPSEAHRRYVVTLLDLPETRLTVLPHGALPTLTMRQSREWRPRELSREPLQLGHWGYLMYEKGTHLILEAVRKLRDPSAVQLHLIGTTVEQEYEQRLRELACDLSVQFHGAYRPSDLQAYCLDLAVFASIASESYSFALDEALCLGLPILVSDRGALAERIGGAGLTFRAGDAENLAQRLQEILDAPEVLNVMRRHIQPEMLFSMETHAAMLEKIYEDAVQTYKPKIGSTTHYLKLIAHTKQQVQEREDALKKLQMHLAQYQQMFNEKEVRLQQAECTLEEKEVRLQQAECTLEEKEVRLQQAERTLEEKEARLQQAERALRSLQEELANLRRTPLFKLQALLTRLSQRP